MNNMIKLTAITGVSIIPLHLNDFDYSVIQKIHFM